MKGLDVNETALRVVVHENPYARMPLHRELFIGPYDERYGPQDEHISWVFAGDGITKLEALAHKNSRQ